ncbi:MAG: hypothetical protein H0U01_09785 [Acidimicrobiia bacterium]|nr:hypothetical protein [Acidimicrobiia bacterium]
MDDDRTAARSVRGSGVKTRSLGRLMLLLFLLLVAIAVGVVLLLLNVNDENDEPGLDIKDDEPEALVLDVAA